MKLFTASTKNLLNLEEGEDEPVIIPQSKSFIKPTSLLAYEEMSEISSAVLTNIDEFSEQPSESGSQWRKVSDDFASFNENQFDISDEHCFPMMLSREVSQE